MIFEDVTVPRQRGAGRPRKVDIGLMAVFALLLVRAYGVDRKPAARAAIRAYFTGVGAEHPDRRVAVHLDAVMQRLKKLKSGRETVHPDLISAVGWADRATGKPVFGTVQDMAQYVAQFLEK